MKDFNWASRQRILLEYNYNAWWNNLETIRFGIGKVKELPCDKSEFYDIAITENCNLGCDFCYVAAKKGGKDYTNICEKAKYFFGLMSDNDKPFQCAIGSTGEPTIHPEFCEFLKTLFDLKIVPNYTTNGITIAADSSLSKKILDYTEKYCGGVAVSANMFDNKIEKAWKKAVNKLSNIDVHINIHYIISDVESAIKFCEIYNEYKDIVKYFVLLPLMPSGRSTKKYTKDAFNIILNGDFDFSKISFGAHFYEDLKSQNKIQCWLYPPESYSKNLILDDSIKITSSSFNLTPIKTILWKK